MSIDRKKLFRTVLLGSCATAMTGVAFGANGVAFAQDADDDDEAVEEVTITGTRIPRQDLVANSPVAVVGAEEISLTGQVKVGELLNDVPQVVPGVTTVNNNPGGTVTTLDLRGLGPQRTLILVNGRRWVPANLAGISDAGSIPAGMIERVDIVTGGASATYGSDAMAGVINFILKDDFEGLSSTAQYSLQSHGDGDQFYVDATMGSNFADGRGNVMINVSWFKQNPIFQGDRAFSSVVCSTSFFGYSVPTAPYGPQNSDSPCGAFDPTASATGTNAFHASGSSRVLQGRIDGILGSAIGSSGVRSLVFNNNGTTAHRFFGPITFSQAPGPDTSIDLYNYAPPNYLQLPVTRTTMNLQGHYDINDDVEFFMSASFVNTDIATRLAPVPVTTRVNLHTSNPFFAGITVGDNGADLLDVLVLSACALQYAAAGCTATTAAAAQAWIAANNNGNFTFGVRRRTQEVGAREAPTDMDTYQFTVGFRGQFANGWNWDTFYQYSKFRRQSSVRNDIHATRFKQAIDARFNANNNTTSCGPIQPTQGSLGTAAAGGCVPVNIFGLNSITPDMVNYIIVDATQETEFEREMFAFNLQGDIVELPAGALAFAAGVEARRESGRFSPDDVYQQGLTLGFNATQPTRGRINVWEAYMETLIPLISEKAFFKYLAIEAGVRWSKYSTVGSIWTWKLGGEWRVFDDLKLRGLFQRAVRAPNISELFAGVRQNFPGYTDPCNGVTAASTSAYAACVAWGIPGSFLAAGFNQTDTQVQAAVSSNPNLLEETANTWTVGGVFTPHQIPNLEIIIDYYSISIKNGVGAAFGGTRGTINTCFSDLLANPGSFATSQACQFTPRNALGQLGGLLNPVIITSANLSLLSTKGLDVTVRYNFDLEDAIGIPGTINLDALYTHVFSNGFASFANSPLSDFSGTFGLGAGGTIPKDKVAARATYRKGAYAVSLRWTMVGNVNCIGAPYCGVNSTGARHVLDLTFNWEINDTVGITLGVENILAADPVFLGGYSVESNTDPSVYNAQLLGPRFFGSVRANF